MQVPASEISILFTCADFPNNVVHTWTNITILRSRLCHVSLEKNLFYMRLPDVDSEVLSD